MTNTEGTDGLASEQAQHPFGAHRPLEPVLDKPHAARVYDYYIGGAQHWAVDREFAEGQINRWPPVRPLAWQNRMWMTRVVREALDAGITQFIDIGAGLPNDTSPLLIADAYAPNAEARVCSVDHEPVVASHTRLIIEDHALQDRWSVAHQDVRSPTTLRNDSELKRVIDFTQPVCYLMVAVWHFITPMDRPQYVANRIKADMPIGSWLALSHLAVTEQTDKTEQAAVAEFRKKYEHTQNRLCLRNPQQLDELLAGLDYLEPGMSNVADWRADPAYQGMYRDDAALTIARKYSYALVARKPEGYVD